MKPQPIRLCLVDMNNGVANQAIRCFRRIIDVFAQRILAANPDLELTLTHVQPRNLGELPSNEVDLVLSSGGPGSPFDGYQDPWCTGYRKFLDYVVEQNQKDGGRAPQALLVCHSFELGVAHFKVAKVVKRAQGRKFGVQPVYTTPGGTDSALYRPFADRLFAFENRFWEAVEPDEARMRALGTRILARESRPGKSDKGTGLMGLDFAPGICGTQYHPEADRQGVMTWVNNPETAEEFKKVYGEPLYKRMVKTVDDPQRVARTFALQIPGWLTERFNIIAAVRGLKPLTPPIQRMDEFAPKAPAAV